MSEPAPDISSLRPKTPARLKAVLEKLLAKDRCKRFAEPQELVNALAPLCLDADLAQLSALVSTERFKGQAELKPVVSCLPLQNQTTTSPVYSRETVLLPRPNRRSRKIALVVMASVLVALVAGYQMLWNDNVADQGSQNRQTARGFEPRRASSTNQAASNSHDLLDTNSVNSAVVVPVITTPNKVEAAILGPIAQRWKKEFGSLPSEVLWPGRSGLGTWRIDEELKSLVIQTSKTIRLVDLGHWKLGDQGFLLTISLLPQSKRGEFGIFWGYQDGEFDNPLESRFQVMQLSALPSVLPAKKLFVRRYLAELDGQTGQVTAAKNGQVEIEIPEGPDSLKLEVQMTKDGIERMTLSGHDCVDLYNDSRNARYSAKHYDGKFGIFAIDATVWFSNPHFERNRQ